MNSKWTQTSGLLLSRMCKQKLWKRPGWKESYLPKSPQKERKNSSERPWIWGNKWWVNTKHLPTLSLPQWRSLRVCGAGRRMLGGGCKKKVGIVGPWVLGMTLFIFPSQLPYHFLQEAFPPAFLSSRLPWTRVLFLISQLSFRIVTDWFTWVRSSQSEVCKRFFL